MVIHPTDTVYALAVDAENAAAVNRVYQLKRRPPDKPLTIAVSDLDMLTVYAVADPFVELIKRFLPGPVTLILPKTGRVPPEVNPRAIGIRISDSLIAREIPKRLGRAVTATSANLTSHAPPHTCSEAVSELAGADLALDAGLLPRRTPSTVIDLTGAEPVLVREGPVSFEGFLRTYREFAQR